MPICRVGSSASPLRPASKLPLHPACLTILAAAAALSGCGGESSSGDSESKGATSSTGTASSSISIGLPPHLPPHSSSGVTGSTEVSSTGTSVVSTGTVDTSGTIGTSGTGGSTTGSSASSEKVPDAGHDAAVPPLAAVPLYVCSSQAYTLAMTVGTQTFNLQLDTGSGPMAVAASTCSNCFQSPEYTPGPTATDTNQPATYLYGSGEWTGEIYQDTASVAGEPGTPFDFVSITNGGEFFEPTVCNSPAPGMQGIIGFSPPYALLLGPSPT